MAKSKVTKLSAELRLAVALMEGATVVAHICFKEPKKAEQVPQMSLGAGTFTRDGGSFDVKLPGRAVCLAVVWEGKVVRSYPDKLPMDVVVGPAKCGPLSLGTVQ